MLFFPAYLLVVLEAMYCKSQVINSQQLIYQFYADCERTKCRNVMLMKVLFDIRRLPYAIIIMAYKVIILITG